MKFSSSGTILANLDSVKHLLGNEPQMIGTIPGIGCLDDQLTLFFDFWINQNKHYILSTVKDEQTFFNQLTLMRSDGPEFISFLHKWKLLRILKNDSFSTVWNWLVEELNIECSNQKAEDDADEKDDAEFQM